MLLTMAQNEVMLHFRFATFGDSMLQKMNLLRHSQHFCDVVVRINQLEVPGHRVVFAAGSSLLRDQFLLQQDSREVQISMIQDAEVGRQLLLSCYTGQLEFPELELVHYLTVASFLQMGHVVEQCTQALSKSVKPEPPCKLEMDMEMKIDIKEEGPSSSFDSCHVQVLHQDLAKVEGSDNIIDHNDVTVPLEFPFQILGAHHQQGTEQGGITTVKVEPSAENAITSHFPTSLPCKLEMDMEMKMEIKEEGLSSSLDSCHVRAPMEDDDKVIDHDVIRQLNSPLQILGAHHQQGTEQQDGITTVKVEPLSDVAENAITSHFPNSLPCKLEMEVKMEIKEEAPSSPLMQEACHVQTFQKAPTENGNKVIDHSDAIPPKSPLQTSKQVMEERSITIAKVESLSDGAENAITSHFPTSSPTPLGSAEPQHSLISPTMDCSSEGVAPPMAAPLPSPPPAHPSTKKYQQNSEKPPQEYQCPKCTQVFHQLENYANHLKMHKLFLCPLCRKTFRSKRNMEQHKLLHDNINSFECKNCGKTFTYKTNLQRHMQMHTSNRPFSCKICGKNFNRKDYLEQHMSLHADITPFKCKICSKTFKHRVNLQRHMNRHAAIKPFQCKICEKSFIRNACLERHMLVHTDIKPFQCKICKKTFIINAYLEQHMHVHTGIKPFQCKICKKTFTRNTCLVRHMFVHDDIKPFPCNMCKKTFIRKACLEKHMHVHTGIKEKKK